ncbi:hypothetical protein DEJ73_05180 [Chromohalobacter salexigens]|nr:hypothetical protein [Chromohalobacter salexigens]
MGRGGRRHRLQCPASPLHRTARDGAGVRRRSLSAKRATPDRRTCTNSPELPRYVRDRVLLVGDVAHAMLPHQGAGSGRALEDDYVLASLLSEPACDRDDVAEVLAYRVCLARLAHQGYLRYRM